MPAFTNPMDSLVSLQQQVRRGFETHQAELSPSIRVVVDTPRGVPRYTYAKIEHGRVKALSVFVLTEPLDGVRCFNLGYAVPDAYTGKGWATEITEQGIAELRHGLGRNGVNEFYIEAVVSVNNLASQRVAQKLFQNPPVEITDSESGEPALQYLRLVQC